ncbi:hypothetical protein OG339_12045 [Streptosporangium sp. NBC_01495]|nr:hypothetical protein [Streptosporangium sp. NBC_01495]
MDVLHGRRTMAEIRLVIDHRLGRVFTTGSGDDPPAAGPGPF